MFHWEWKLFGGCITLFWREGEMMSSFLPIWGQGACPDMVSKDWKLVKLCKKSDASYHALSRHPSLPQMCFIHCGKKRSYSGLPAWKQLNFVVSICLVQRKSCSPLGAAPASCPSLVILKLQSKRWQSKAERKQRERKSPGNKGILLLGKPCFSSFNEQIRDMSCWCPSIGWKCKQNQLLGVRIQKGFQKEIAWCFAERWRLCRHGISRKEEMENSI